MNGANLKHFLRSRAQRLTSATTDKKQPHHAHAQVSWLRPIKNEILTAGRFTYIGDQRISSLNENGSNDWVLEIKDVGLNDSTSYECQVSTDPKMSMIINLHVLGKFALR